MDNHNELAQKIVAEAPKVCPKCYGALPQFCTCWKGPEPPSMPKGMRIGCLLCAPPAYFVTDKEYWEHMAAAHKRRKMVL